MSNKKLALFIPFVTLLIASLACNRLTGGAASGFQATADAAFTQAASGAATAGAQGNSAVATANAAATALVATANAATGGDATATPASGQPTAAATTSGDTGGGTIANGGPADIPVIANGTVQVANANLLSYVTDADITAVVKFYKDSMPKNGWTLNAATSIQTATAATVGFTKGAHNAQVTIGTANGKTVVAITVS